MRTDRFAVAALCSCAAMFITAGTAAAQPGSPTSASDATNVVHGVDHGVGYTVRAVHGPHGSVVTTLDAATFKTTDGRGVAVTNPSGSTIATIPTSLRLRDQVVNFRPRIDADARTLTLEPIDAFDDDISHPSPLQMAAGAACALAGAVGGAVLGLVGGIVIGLLFLIVGVIPGVLLGPIVGAGAGASFALRGCFDLTSGR